MRFYLLAYLKCIFSYEADLYGQVLSKRKVFSSTDLSGFLDGALELAFLGTEICIRTQVENFYKLLTWKTVVLSPSMIGNDLSMMLWPSLVFQSQCGCKAIHVSKRYKISEFAYVNAQVFSLWDKSIPNWQFYLFLSRVRLYMNTNWVKTNISWKIQGLQKVKYFLLCGGEEEINFPLRAYSHQTI